MITPELIGYIRGEFAKGRTREEIRASLVTEGWSEADLSEAFRVVIPMQNFEESSVNQKSSSASPSHFPSWKIPLIIIVVGALGFALWFYRLPLMSLWNSGVDKITGLSSYFFGSKTDNTDSTAAVPNNPVIKNTVNCGVSNNPDLDNPLTYENNAVLTCLGNSALLCENAQALLQDALFPEVFQIIRNQETCSFRLSYSQDSTLMDITGRKLAGQYISCPVNIVKAVDNTNPASPKFIPIEFNKTSLSKYASQIYFYGILGLFMENDVDLNKILALGCSGTYIDSVIASYQKMQER